MIWARITGILASLGYNNECRWLKTRSTHITQADFKGMLEALLVHHGVKDVEFLRKSLPPKLESLGISSLIPTVDQPGVIDEKRTTEANQVNYFPNYTINILYRLKCKVARVFQVPMPLIYILETTNKRIANVYTLNVGHSNPNVHPHSSV